MQQEISAREYLGAHPIVDLMLSWRKGAVGDAVALRRAAEPQIVDSLSPEQLGTLSDRCVRWSYQRHWQDALLLHRLLMARVVGYRSLMHRFALRMPLFGKLVHKSLVARFARTFGTLIQSGVPHLDALDILQASTNNVHMRSAVGMVQSSIREGAGFAVPMGESGMFDDIVVNMVDVGEQTGELDRMLTKVADRYEIEVDRTIETTFKLIEPILLVFLAVAVGFIVFALFMPLLTMMQQMGKR